MTATDNRPTDVDDAPPVTDRAGRALPAWVPADHPLAGTALRPTSAGRRGSRLERWFPMLALVQAPAALFVIWLRNPPVDEAAVVGGWASAVAIALTALLVAGGRRRRR